MSILKLTSFLTGAAILLGGMSMTASLSEAYALTKTYQEYTFTYTVTDGKAVITGCKGEGENLVIPQTLDGYKVTEIGAKAFAGLGLFSRITIPDGVEVIGERAFCDCSLVSNVVIPDSVTTIKDGAFLNCKSLQIAEIGSGLKNVGMYIFGACPKLYLISVNKDNKYFATSDKMLVSYDKKSLIQYAGNTNSVKIPDYITSVMSGAFFGLTNINEVIIPNSVTNIDSYAFSGCLQLKSIEIPDSVKTIGEACFMNCTGLKTVKLGNSLEKVEKRSFSMCSSLESVSFGEALASIEEEAFYGCASLKEIYVPTSVKSISKNALGTYYDLRTGSNVVYSDFMIRGEKGSVAETYAKNTGLKFLEKGVILGDVTGEGAINALDASIVLSEYAKTSVGEKESFTAAQKLAADYNFDNKINAYDASLILAEYARLSTS